MRRTDGPDEVGSALRGAAVALLVFVAVVAAGLALLVRFFAHR
jgi:hypothetical protein